MPRHLLSLAYDGTAYHGWQRQPHSSSVQETFEQALATLLREDVALTGCGRTDTGVHARAYVAHFDCKAETLPEAFLRRLNGLLPQDLVAYECRPAGASVALPGQPLHARYDATRRAYRYEMVRRYDPFRRSSVWHYAQFDQLNQQLMQAAADLLREYEDFAPFRKSKSDARTSRCRIDLADWTFRADGAYLDIAADRFLRGMVRFVVGMCVNVGLGRMSLVEVRLALDEQAPLPRSWSVPAQGLALTEIAYPDWIVKN